MLPRFNLKKKTINHYKRLALLIITRRNRIMYANYISTKHNLTFVQSAPAAWKRSRFGAKFVFSKFKTLKNLMALFWKKTQLLLLQETQWFGKKTSICLSRGPMARKKQSREQLTDSPVLSYLSLVEPQLKLSKPKARFFNLVQPANALSLLSTLTQTGKQFNSNLVPIKNHTTYKTLSLWRLGKIK